MAKFAGRTAVLKVGDGATPTEAFAAVGQVRQIGAFGSTRALIDASTHGDDWMDFVGGQKEGTELSIIVAFDDADSTHTGLQTDYDNNASRNFKVEHSGVGYQWTISTVVTGWQVESALDGLLIGTLTAKIVNPGVVGATLP